MLRDLGLGFPRTLVRQREKLGTEFQAGGVRGVDVDIESNLSRDDLEMDDAPEPGATGRVADRQDRPAGEVADDPWDPLFF